MIETCSHVPVNIPYIIPKLVFPDFTEAIPLPLKTEWYWPRRSGLTDPGLDLDLSDLFKEF